MQGLPKGKKGAVLVIHGGAGVIRRDKLIRERRAACESALKEALTTGYAVIRQGGSSIEAVESTVKYLEDSPLFNSAKGAVFTRDGRIELDASIMDGLTRKAGAVACATRIKNPISAARALMDQSHQVLLSGAGADDFALSSGLPLVDPAYFWTQDRWNQYLEVSRAQLSDAEVVQGIESLGTVGAVALDQAGNLAAGTSTGGLANQPSGRIGDSPIIGAGTYADNESCAVSATGQGEYIMRFVVASDIAFSMQYRGLSLEQACEEVVNKKLTAAGGEAGVVALDVRGNFALVFNSPGMYRGYIGDDGQPKVSIFKEQPA